MHILINASFWHQPTVGSGQYLHGLARWLPQVGPQHRYTLLVPATAMAAAPAPPPGVRLLPLRTPFDGRNDNLAKLWFEQVSVPTTARILSAQQAVRSTQYAVRSTLLHIPYFAPPLRCAVPVVTTVGDIIPLLLPEYRGGPHVQAYMALVQRAVRGSAHLLTFSAWSKRDIVAHLGLPPERITATLLAADDRYQIDSLLSTRSTPSSANSPQSTQSTPSFLTEETPEKPSALSALSAVKSQAESPQSTQSTPSFLTEETPEKPSAVSAISAVNAGSALSAVNKKYGLTPPFIYYVGGLDARKNVATLVRAFGLLRGQGYHHVTLAIAGKALGGDTRLFPDLDGLIAELGLTEAVRRISVPHEDGPLLYQTATIFAFPSRYEGFGLPPLEAMASGTPVVCSTASSLPEVVEEAALLVEPDDVAGWAAALRRLLDDEQLREELETRGLARAAHFSYRRVAEETLAVYKEVNDEW